MVLYEQALASMSKYKMHGFGLCAMNMSPSANLADSAYYVKLLDVELEFGEAVLHHQLGRAFPSGHQV